MRFSFSIGFYLSTDAVITTNDTLLGTRRLGFLAPGQESAAVTPLALSSNLPPGSYYVGAIVDFLEEVPESIETNNIILGNVIEIGDLNSITTAFSGPASAAALETIPITNSVASQESVGPFTIAFYLSSDSSISTNDYRLGQRTVAGLASGQTNSAVTPVAIPQGLPTGTYYFGAIVEGSAAAASVGNVIEMVSRQDLVVAASGPTSFAAGSFATVTDVSRNVGMRDVSQAFYVGFYASADPVITTNDILLGGRFVSSGLAAGQSNAASTSLLIPMELPPGTYYLGAVVDYRNNVAEASESNNTFTVGLVEVVFGPDLAQTTFNGPASVTTGVPFDVTDMLANAGAGGAFFVRVGYYLSSDGTIATNDMFLGYRSIGFLPAGQMSSATTSLIVTSTIPAGTYYLGAIADPLGTVPEGDENNNTILHGPIEVTTGPDLAGVSVNGPALASASESILITNTIQNLGIGAAGPFSVGLYLSTDAVITTNDLKIGTQVLASGLGAGQSSSVATAVVLSTNVPNGTYHLGGIIDAAGTVVEANESNNTVAGGLIQIVPRADLVVTEVSGPGTVLAGGSFFIVNTISNAGGRSVSGTFRTGLYLSESPWITTGDLLVGAFNMNGLGPGQSSTTNSLITIHSGIVPGEYYLGALVDDTFLMPEADETNNGRVGNVIRIIVSEIIDAHRSGSDFIVRFTTAPQRSYRLERSGTLNGSSTWAPVPGAENVMGTGGTVTVTDFGADSPMRFYRVRLLF